MLHSRQGKTAEGGNMRKLVATLAVALVAFLAVGASPAAATPPSGSMAQPLVDVTFGPWHFFLQRVTILPGGTSGWHLHVAGVRLVVISGTVTVYSSDCVGRD